MSHTSYDIFPKKKANVFYHDKDKDGMRKRPNILENRRFKDIKNHIQPIFLNAKKKEDFNLADLILELKYFFSLRSTYPFPSLNESRIVSQMGVMQSVTFVARSLHMNSPM